MLLYLVVAHVMGAVAAIIAHERGRSSLGWFGAGVLIGPFALAVALLPRVARPGRFVHCGTCHEVVRVSAEICPFCRSPRLTT